MKVKRVKYLIILLVAIFLFDVEVLAASGNLKVSSSSVYVGDSFTVTANVSSAAAWNVHVSASGPVSGCVINQADATSDAMDANKTFSATCTATGTGTITIRLSGDVTSSLDGNAVYVSDSKSVNVSVRPTVPSNEENNNSNNNNNNNNNNSNNNVIDNNTNNSNQVVDNRSKNNNIKELSVEGYKLVKVDNNNYTLSVGNDVSSIDVKVVLEDDKAKVTGDGKVNLNVGENNVELVVVAENGEQNKVVIKVTRKDGYYLEDLESLLSDSKISDININIKSDTTISKSLLKKIKNSKKEVKFNYYDIDKSLSYSWIIDGKRLEATSDFLTTVVNELGNKKNILRLSNYADGLFMGLKQKAGVPDGAMIRLFVGNKYDDGDVLNIYAYFEDGDKLESLENGVMVEDGYVVFEVVDNADYFITMSNIPGLNEIVTNGGKVDSILSIKLVIMCLFLMIIMVILFVKYRKRKKQQWDIVITGDSDDIGNAIVNDYESVSSNSSGGAINFNQGVNSGVVNSSDVSGVNNGISNYGQMNGSSVNSMNGVTNGGVNGSSTNSVGGNNENALVNNYGQQGIGVGNEKNTNGSNNEGIFN